MSRLPFFVLLAALASCAAFWAASPSTLTVERSVIDPPAGAILERVRAYAEAEEGEDPSILPTAESLSSALEAGETVRVAPWSPLASGGMLQVYYRESTMADPLLPPATAEGRVLAAELLGDALERVLNPPK